MAVEIATAYVSLVPSAKGFSQKLGSEIDGPLTKSAGDTGENMGKSIGGTFTPAIKKLALTVGGLFAAGAAVQFGKSIIAAASDMNESINKVDVVFEDSAREIQNWSRTAAQGMGISRQEALESAGTFGNLFRAMKVGTPEATRMSKGMVELASDLASFNNADPSEVLEALRSGLVGETEPMRRFGVSLSAARVQAKAFELGLQDANGELSAGAKAQAAYAIIMEDTGLAQGDFARTSDGLANSQRILSANWKDAQAQLGQALLPIMTKVVQFLSGQFLPALQQIIAVFSEQGFSGVMRLARERFEELDLPIKILIGSVVALGVAIFAITSPVLATIAAFVAIGVALAVLYKQNEGFRKFWDETWASIAETIRGVTETITVLWHAFGDDIVTFARQQFEALVTTIRGLLDIVLGIVKVFTSLLRGDFSEAWEGIKQIFSGAVDVIVGTVFSLLSRVQFILGLVVQVFRDVPGQILDAIGDLGSLLYQKGRDLASGLLRGFRDAAGSLAGKILDPFGIARGTLDIFGFASGGVVPGAVGAPMLAVVHGGETVIPVGGGAGGGITINWYGTVIDGPSVRGVIPELVTSIRAAGANRL